MGCDDGMKEHAAEVLATEEAEKPKRKWVWVNDNDRIPLDQLMQAYVTTQ